MSKTNRPADVAIPQMEKINPELFSLMYGSFVLQLIKDYRDVQTVNVELYKVGYNMGIRLVDEFFAKSSQQACRDFAETVQVIAKIAFKMFLNVDAEVSKILPDGVTFHISFKTNPLTDFVELPQGFEQLHFSNVICGAITGALRMLQLVVECTYVQDKLKGSNEDEIAIKLIEVVNEGYIDDEM